MRFSGWRFLVSKKNEERTICVEQRWPNAEVIPKSWWRNFWRGSFKDYQKEIRKKRFAKRGWQEKILLENFVFPQKDARKSVKILKRSWDLENPRLFVNNVYWRTRGAHQNWKDQKLDSVRARTMNPRSFNLRRMASETRIPSSPLQANAALEPAGLTWRFTAANWASAADRKTAKRVVAFDGPTIAVKAVLMFTSAENCTQCLCE